LNKKDSRQKFVQYKPPVWDSAGTAAEQEPAADKITAPPKAPPPDSAAGQDALGKPPGGR